MDSVWDLEKLRAALTLGGGQLVGLGFRLAGLQGSGFGVLGFGVLAFV